MKDGCGTVEKQCSTLKPACSCIRSKLNRARKKKRKCRLITGIRCGQAQAVALALLPQLQPVLATPVRSCPVSSAPPLGKGTSTSTVSLDPFPFAGLVTLETVEF